MTTENKVLIRLMRSRYIISRKQKGSRNRVKAAKRLAKPKHQFTQYRDGYALYQF